MLWMIKYMETFEAIYTVSTNDHQKVLIAVLHILFIVSQKCTMYISSQGMLGRNGTPEITNIELFIKEDCKKYLKYVMCLCFYLIW